MQESILDQGVNLMLYGMGSVFFFLTVLIVATVAMSAFVQRFFPQAPEPQANAPRPQAPATAVEPRVVAIIQAAIEQHRSK